MTTYPRRSVFYISDRTGITAETLGHSLITQFDQIPFNQVTLPFIDTKEKACEAVKRINTACAADGVPALLFGTVITPAVREILSQSQGHFLDLFQTFIGPLEQELGVKSNHAMGRSHAVNDAGQYNIRMEAVNFALKHDDGASTRNYDQADVILLGVSRCGKTPTSLYLAMQYGVRVANYPITEEDMDRLSLPEPLMRYKSKLFGLTIDPRNLSHIRQLRRPDSPYAALRQCQQEVGFVEQLYLREHIPYLSSTNRSVEEMATKILASQGIERGIR